MMEWPTLKYPLQDVDAAGNIITDLTVTLANYERAIDIVNNWRAAHKFPLNTIQVLLRDRAARVDSKVTVAQRLKRLFAIEHKLERFGDWLTLSEMQDIGGCRAILESPKMVDELIRRFMHTPSRHELIDYDDYVTKPKKTGYRSIHLIYRFRSDKSPAFNGRKIEMQVRSRSQHVWATAVEMGGLITGKPLKSGIGDPEWLTFFELMGDDMALREGTPPRDTGTTRSGLATKIRELEQRLHIQERIEALTLAVRAISPEAKRAKNATFLVILDAVSGTLRVETYKRQTQDQQLAFDDLISKERSIRTRPNEDVILIETESIKSLERAYPNYFLDTDKFLREVKTAMR